MPSFDGGHYFFTAAVPVCNDGIVEHEGMKSSPIHMVREALETLPTALQSHAAEAVGIQSPFARSLRTHLARFVVLDQPTYNGRDRRDPILNAATGADLLKAEPHDALPCPYLLMMVDFDPVDPTGRGEPRAYLEELWILAPAELSAVFGYCYGFSEVTDPSSFATFLLACEIETTMPFNDYWVGTPPLTSLPMIGLAAVPAIGAVLMLAGLAAWVASWGHVRLGPVSPVWMAWGLLVLLAGVLIDYLLVMAKGGRPFPSNPDGSLRSVLKALYLQQAFTRFAAEQQDRDPAGRGAALRAFLAEHRPADLSGPTQPPGVIRSVFPGAGA